MLQKSKEWFQLSQAALEAPADLAGDIGTFLPGLTITSNLWVFLTNSDFCVRRHNIITATLSSHCEVFLNPAPLQDASYLVLQC